MQDEVGAEEEERQVRHALLGNAMESLNEREQDILAERRAAADIAGWKPKQPRKRKITTALRAYASMATSAARGAVRVVPDCD